VGDGVRWSAGERRMVNDPFQSLVCKQHPMQPTWPSPTSWVCGHVRHRSTGSRTHLWLYAVTHFVGSWSRSPSFHGFADSPVALCRHPLRGFIVRFGGAPTGSRTHLRLHTVTHFVGSSSGSAVPPRVRGLTRGFMPSPTSWVFVGVFAAAFSIRAIKLTAVECD
jgi:hypothetical protein